MEPVKGFPIVLSNTNCIRQEAKYEKLGFYCSKCFRQGHMSVVCRVEEKKKDEGNLKGKKIWQPKNMELVEKNSVMGARVMNADQATSSSNL